MINIIGGGPAGCNAGYLLAKSGMDVCIFEEHSKIGSPVQCTGLVTSAIKDYVKLRPEAVMNNISAAKIYAPNKKSVEFKLREKNIILDRGEFDRTLALYAEDAGVRVLTGCRFIGIEGEKILLVHKKKKMCREKEILVGADGPLSPVAKACGLFENRMFVHGLQVTAKIKCNPDLVEFWLGYGSFAWVVPESNSAARVGIVASKNANEVFQRFLKDRVGRAKAISHEAGPIPVFNPDIRANKDNIYLVGDAATQVKATTFGGIVQGLSAGKCLCKSIVKSKDYDKVWRSEMGGDLMYSLRLRRVMDRFSAENYNKLLELVSSDKVRKIIEDNDRDYISSYIWKLILAKPSLLRFGWKLVF